MQLRAAIAAVNTIDMRDNDDDVTSRQVTLVDGNNPNLPIVYATVYGAEPQPFITEVYATNQQNGSAQPRSGLRRDQALFNPLQLSDGLTNYRLGRCSGTGTPPTAALLPNLSIAEVVPSTSTFWTGSATQDPPPFQPTAIIITAQAIDQYTAVSIHSSGRINRLYQHAAWRCDASAARNSTPPVVAGVQQIPCYGIRAQFNSTSC